MLDVIAHGGKHMNDEVAAKVAMVERCKSNFPFGLRRRIEIRWIRFRGHG
jgi:hypothetical protein